MKKLIPVALILGMAALSIITASSQTPSEIIGCVYNASLPTLANRQTTALQCDSSGNLILAP